VRAGLGFGEHVAERLVDRLAEHALERIGEGVAEHAAERVAEKHVGGFLRMWRPTESLKRGAKSAFHRFMEGSSEHGLQSSVAAREQRSLKSSVLALKISVTLFGLLLVLHMARKDWRRAQEELEAKQPSGLAHFCFMSALLCDAVDAFVHLMVIVNLTIWKIGHDNMEQLERLGFGCAVAGTLALVIGELLSMTNSTKGKRAVVAVGCKEH